MKNMFDDHIDEQKLRENYKKDPLFRTLMDFFSTEPKDHRSITVDVLCDKLAARSISIRRSEVIRALQSLSGHNRGWFTIGRRGWPSRFEFHVSSIALAKAASSRDDGEKTKKVAAMLTHRFRLRADLEISLELPTDLTDKEVTRISDFLKTLPFEHADLKQAA
jgi:hypothetical protein